MEHEINRITFQVSRIISPTMYIDTHLNLKNYILEWFNMKLS